MCVCVCGLNYSVVWITTHATAVGLNCEVNKFLFFFLYVFKHIIIIIIVGRYETSSRWISVRAYTVTGECILGRNGSTIFLRKFPFAIRVDFLFFKVASKKLFYIRFVQEYDER